MKKSILKKAVSLAAAVVMVTAMSVTAFANEASTIPAAPGFAGCPFGGWGMAGYGIMWSEDGTTFLDRSAFEARVDDLIAQGLIYESDRDAFMERYDWCAVNVGSAFGCGSGGCRRFIADRGFGGGGFGRGTWNRANRP
jgi:hypothetical protein